MAEGDVFSTEKLRKGLENMRKLYGEFGYIDFVPEPDFESSPTPNKMDLTITVDEGKQFFVRRIDFTGNTTTRDKVIRREMLIDEGDMFNTRLWELSILRLNQLGYFEALKEDEAADIKRDTKTNTVDITLKVKERGKNSIGLNGGVSGIAGTFHRRSTIPPTTSSAWARRSVLSSQLGTRMRNVSFGFTEPYLFDRPMQAGFTVYLPASTTTRRREASILSGQNLIRLYNSSGHAEPAELRSERLRLHGLRSAPLRRSFARVGIDLRLRHLEHQDADHRRRQTYFDYINFSGVGGPNSLNGINTSQITPSYTYNTVNHPIKPTGGKSIFVSAQFAGSVLGGNVNTIRPTSTSSISGRAPFSKGHVMGFHFMGVHAHRLRRQGGAAFHRAPTSAARTISAASISGASARSPSCRAIHRGQRAECRWQRPHAERSEREPGARHHDDPDLSVSLPRRRHAVVGNFEYRIPIVGPVTLALSSPTLA